MNGPMAMSEPWGLGFLANPVQPPRARPLRSRLLVAVVVVALVALLLGHRDPLRAAVPGRAPVDRSVVGPINPAARPTDAARDRAERAGIDVDRTVDTLSHTVVPGPVRAGTLTVRDREMSTVFDADGFRASPTPGSELRLSLAHVGRAAGPAIDVGPGAWSAHGNVASREVSDGVQERVTASDGALEWDVVLAGPPAGTGPLRVAAALDGLERARRTTSEGRPSWLLTLEGGGHLRIGEVVVVDSTGAELHRALPRIEGGALHVDVPAKVLAVARYPLVLDPTVSAQKPAGLLGAEDIQWFSDIAWSGTQYLVVWSDYRANPGDIYGARLAPSGAILDPGGIPIADGSDSEIFPAVAWNGTVFLVVWQDEIGTSDYEIHGARVSSGGTVLDAAGLPIATGAPAKGPPDVASNGSEFLVVWSGPGVQAARMSNAGSILGGGSFPINAAGSAPNVAWNGSRYLVVWQATGSGSDVRGSRVTSTGGVDDPAGLAIATVAGNQGEPGVASNGTEFLVVWEDASSGTTRVSGARVTTAGAVTALATAISTTPSKSPRVASNGSDYMVVWEDSRAGAQGVYGGRITAAGAVQDPSGIRIASIPSALTAPAVASDGTGYLPVYAYVGESVDVFANRVTDAGAVVHANGYAVSTSPASHAQSDAAVAWDGTHFLVVWTDFRDPGGRIFGARLDGTGSPLGSGFPIAAVSSFQSGPSVVWNGGTFFVAWEDQRNANSDVYGRLVSASGVALGSDVAISTVADVQGAPAVTWDGSNFFVAWEDFRSGTDYDIYGSRVNGFGIVVDVAGIEVSTGTGDQTSPSVASNGSTSLVAWEDSRSGNADIYSTRVSSAGGVQNPSGVALSTLSTAERTPAVASNSTGYLVVWKDHRNATFDIYGSRVNSAGAPVDAAGIPISKANGDQDAPTVAFNGAYLVGWRSRPSGGLGDLYAARVNENGVVQDAAFVVSANAFDEGAPAVSPGPGGNWAVAYDYGQTFIRTVSPK